VVEPQNGEIVKLSTESPARYCSLPGPITLTRDHILGSIDASSFPNSMKPSEPSCVTLTTPSGSRVESLHLSCTFQTFKLRRGRTRHQQFMHTYSSTIASNRLLSTSSPCTANICHTVNLTSALAVTTGRTLWNTKTYYVTRLEIPAVLRNAVVCPVCNDRVHSVISFLQPQPKLLSRECVLTTMRSYFSICNFLILFTKL
jgi:hypothetical protein